MKKTINSILLLTLILSCNFIQTISVFANEIGPNPAIEARADIIEWRYKLENGRVYKRRYNYTKQKMDWRLDSSIDYDVVTLKK